jgi:hypothetical protein
MPPESLPERALALVLTCAWRESLPPPANESAPSKSRPCLHRPPQSVWGSSLMEGMLLNWERHPTSGILTCAHPPWPLPPLSNVREALTCMPGARLPV